jgi:hypothetical protein
VDTLEQEELDFRPFLFLGNKLLGAEITNAVDRQMLTEAECDDLSNGTISEEEVTSLAATRFYESIRRAALLAARAAGPGIVACCERAVWFVKAADWDCDCDIDVAEFAEPLGAAASPLAVLQHHLDASIVCLGANRARAILGRCWARGQIGRAEVSTRGLQHLLEHY